MKYALYPNNLKTAVEGSYLAKIKSFGCVDLERIIDTMSISGSTITKPDARAALEDFFKVIEDFLKDGNTIKLPLLHIKPSIRGQFEDSIDHFDKKRHQLVFTISPGKILNKLPTSVDLQKIESHDAKPLIKLIFDIDDDKKRMIKSIKPGQCVEFSGKNFWFPKHHDEVGIYIICGEQQIKARILKVFNSRHVILLMPDELPEPEIKFKVVVKIPRHQKTTFCYSHPLPVDTNTDF